MYENVLHFILYLIQFVYHSFNKESEYFLTALKHTHTIYTVTHRK